jgi:hypothetical protein
MIKRRKKRRKLKRVGPDAPRELSDIIWPKLHGRWWNWDKRRKEIKSVEELYDGLRVESVGQAQETLEHVEAIAQTAVDRAGAADRRATTIAGTVAIAASFTIGGAGILVDPTKIEDATIRRTFAVVLCVVTVAFILSAIFALRALVSTRTWKWSEPYDLPLDKGESRQKQLGMRAAHLLSAFSYNWEISDLKNRCVDRALQFLVVALLGIAVLSALLVWYTF